MDKTESVESLVTCLSEFEVDEGTDAPPTWWCPTSERNVSVESIDFDAEYESDEDSLETALSWHESDAEWNQHDTTFNQLTDGELKTSFPISQEYSTTEEVTEGVVDPDLDSISSLVDLSSLTSLSTEQTTSSTGSSSYEGSSSDESESESTGGDSNSDLTDASSSIKLPRGHKTAASETSLSAEDISVLELPEKPTNPKRVQKP